MATQPHRLIKGKHWIVLRKATAARDLSESWAPGTRDAGQPGLMAPPRLSPMSLPLSVPCHHCALEEASLLSAFMSSLGKNKRGFSLPNPLPAEGTRRASDLLCPPLTLGFSKAPLSC